jgi:hypothetical protein
MILPFPPRFRQVFSSEETVSISRRLATESLQVQRPSGASRRVCPCVKGGGTQLVVGCPPGQAISGGCCPDGGTRGRGRQSSTLRYSLHWLSIDRQGRAAFLHKAESPGQQVVSRSLTECLSV